MADAIAVRGRMPFILRISGPFSQFVNIIITEIVAAALAISSLQ